MSGRGKGSAPTSSLDAYTRRTVPRARNEQPPSSDSSDDEDTTLDVMLHRLREKNIRALAASAMAAAELARAEEESMRRKERRNQAAREKRANAKENIARIAAMTANLDRNSPWQNIRLAQSSGEFDPYSEPSAH